MDSQGIVTLVPFNKFGGLIMFTWLVSFLCAGIPAIVVFVFVSNSCGFLLGILSYLGAVAVLGTLFRFVSFPLEG